MFRIGGGIRVNSRFAASLSDRSFVLATSSSLPLPLPLKQQQQSCQRIGKTSYYVRRTFSSSSSSGTWNWSNFAAAATDKKENSEGASNDSQESQVLKKTAELYMSLMPLNKKVGKLSLWENSYILTRFNTLSHCLLSKNSISNATLFTVPFLDKHTSFVVHWNSSSKLQMVSKVP